MITFACLLLPTVDECRFNVELDYNSNKLDCHCPQLCVYVDLSLSVYVIVTPLSSVYYGIHKRSECIPVDCGVTNLIHDRSSCVDFTLEVEANVVRCVHSSVNKPGMKRNSGL